ncbi:LysR family transcriptional regulator [Mycobacterium sp. MYCO198283]|uniref:LysR family transcriptional regulator n=1 Tax=Mycobacterium sp. MYCO198283 TaxID=2883505 RepID=UPI001E3BBD00|nr:LysR family transcriptional regulator [Mycobacterium sp. MYCO198283]MCG5433467.1 LysR family transcriptional regulator [Mycobacterium sp. MYCO198283]
MDLRQLEYFTAVVDEGGFTRAAGKLLVAQPAVSAAVARLEREVGQPLLDRRGRSVRLTAAGEAMLPHARAALQAVAHAAAAVDEVAQLVRGTVAIGAVTSHPVDLAALLAEYHDRHPGVEITLGTDASAALLAGVRDGRFDVVIASIGPHETPAGLSVEVVTDEAIEAAVAPRHPLSSRTALHPADLARHPLIALPVGTGIRHQLDTLLAAAGVTARIAFEATNPLELAELAARGLGVAIVPSSVSRHRAGLRALPIDPPIRGRLVLAWRSSGPVSPAARALIALARHQVVSAGA